MILVLSPQKSHQVLPLTLKEDNKMDEEAQSDSGEHLHPRLCASSFISPLHLLLLRSAVDAKRWEQMISAADKSETDTSRPKSDTMEQRTT